MKSSRRPFFRLTLILVALWAAAGCAHQLPPPKDVADLRLNDAHRIMQGSIALRAGVRLILPRPIGPGTEWTLLTNEARVLLQRTPLQAQADGSTTVTFQAIHLGRSVIRVAALKPAATEATPKDLFTVVVEVTEP